MSLLDKIKNLHDKLGISFGDIQLVLGFLSKYGCLAKLGINLDTATIQQILQALQLFHQFHALTMPEDDTELVSPKVINLMGQHRCGVADFMSRTQGKWAATELTYYIGSRDSDMSAQEWDEVIENAFGNWTKVTPLKFKKASSQSSANFVLNIGQGQRDGFDGPSGILAYFELPPIVNFQGQLSGMIDASETWLKTGDSNGRGIYLENVVTHELGHGLGLEHSTIQAALMAPYYNANIRIPQNVDDIPRIQSIYGKPIPTPTPTPVPTPSPTPTPVPTPTPQPTPGKAGQIIINIEGKVTGVSIPGYRSLPI